MKKQLLVLIAAGVLVAIAIIQPGRGPNREQAAKVNFQAPNIELKGLDGQSHSLTQLKGKPLLINFWASWCGPCREETPDLIRLYGKYKDQIEFIGINATFDDTLEGAISFVNEFQLPYPVWLDEQGAVMKTYKVQSYPTTYFVDRNGTILKINLGIVSADALEQTIVRTIRAS